MTAAFLQAAIPDPYRILGIRLRPLCIGHLFLLHRFNCKFITGGDNPWVDDLTLGLLICGQSYEDGLAVMNDRDAFDRDVIRWRESSLRKRFLGIPLWLTRPDWPAKAKLFQDYLDAGQKWPRFYMEDHPSKFEAGAPTLQSVRMTLLSQSSLTHTEVMNMPLGLALYDYLTLGELKQMVQIGDEAKDEDLKGQANAFHDRWMNRNGKVVASGA